MANLFGTNGQNLGTKLVAIELITTYLTTFKLSPTLRLSAIDVTSGRTCISCRQDTIKRGCSTSTEL